MALVEQIKRDGKRKRYDCIIGVSGGTDSSYLLIKALEWGLRPLAVHYDNTWNSAIATENIRKVTSHLNIDLFTYVVDNREADDIFLAFLKAGVPEFDASTDIGFVQVLRQTAAKYGVKYILEAHSFIAEGLTPVGTNYFDGRYIQDVHRRFGTLKKLKSYPNMTFFQFLKWIVWYRQAFVRPLWYISYSKPMAREILARDTGWVYYGGHHLENRATSFLHTIYNPRKFGLDNRIVSLAAEVRAGVVSRNEGLQIMQKPVEEDPELLLYVQKRLGLSSDDFNALLAQPKRTYKDFKTYKPWFERLRPLFYIFAKRGLVTMSFYLKYCFPFKESA